MAELSYTVQGVTELVRRTSASVAIATLRPPMTRSTERLARDLATYPPPSRRPQPPRSERQRRFLMALARAGGIPYRRTGNLGRAWTTDVQETGGGLTGTVGNSVVSPQGKRYGPLVEGEGTQTAYHRGNWPTDQAVLQKHLGPIEADFADAIDKALAG